jgi:5-formaminoimidazole-4-carboxamide-1-(beta)-D-ribofuranosyl 5'-monophosphate synthetase
MYGNRFLLRAEDRKDEKGQYHILKSAGIRIPKQFKKPEEIDRLAIVKVQQAGNELERAFFYVKNAEDYSQQAEKLIIQGVISEKTLKEARIEEYVLGARYNANFHKFALTEFFGDFDFVGTSDRRQVNLQGFLNLPAREQLKLDVPVKNEEIGHFGLTIRESKQPDLYRAAEKLFHSEQLLKDYPPGIIGLCGIQGAMAYSPEKPKELEFVVFDLSPRIPGDPAMGPTTPEMKNLTLKHRHQLNDVFYDDTVITDPLDLSIMEICKAAKSMLLERIVT